MAKAPRDSTQVRSTDTHRAPGVGTRAVHAGETQRPPRRPVAVPIYQTAPFAFDDVHELDRAFDPQADDADSHNALYSRYGNPSVRVVEEKVAALEGAEDAVAFASGMGAITGALSTLLRPGDRLLAAAELYGGTHSWLGWFEGHHGDVSVDRVSLEDLAEHLEAGPAPDTRVVYLETPTNPLLLCCDLERVCAAARRHDLAVVVDNTFATPVLQNPLALGAHLVVHSATKFLAGHSDVTAGVVAGDRATLEAVRETMLLGGACLDPHAAFLVARGIRTVALRVERQSAVAERLAHFLREHPSVARVAWPGFDPVAGKQMRAGGPMLSFELAGGQPAAAVVDRLRLIRIIPSLGGVETGVMIPALASHRKLTAEERAATGITDGLIRVSCGIEDADDLVADLGQALAAV